VAEEEGTDELRHRSDIDDPGGGLYLLVCSVTGRAVKTVGAQWLEKEQGCGHYQTDGTGPPPPDLFMHKASLYISCTDPPIATRSGAHQHPKEDVSESTFILTPSSQPTRGPNPNMRLHALHQCPKKWICGVLEPSWFFHCPLP
jgi:hypothetical protein